jgi:hypothetical protein
VKAIGLAGIVVMLTLSLTSFKPVPEYAAELPTAIAERVTPMPYVIPPQYEWWVRDACERTGVPVWMAARLFSTESTGDPLSGRWNPRAVSWMGAQGLAQVMPVNVGAFSEWYFGGRPFDPFDPQQAIWAGTCYLADLHASTGSWRIAVLAYNGGLGHWTNPRRWGDWQDESISYVKRVMGGER